jgi:hypothetical protein
MTSIATTVKENLVSIVGPKRLTVRIIHDDRDICINSSERELLYAIQTQQRESYNLSWDFSEGGWGAMALILPLTKCPENLEFDGLFEAYKPHFHQRIQQIIAKYDSRTLEPTKANLYDKAKTEYETIKKSNADFESYKRVRDMFQTIRE